MPSVSAWMAIAAVGIFCTAMAYVLYYRMIQTTGPAITSTVTYVVPLFALFYGYLLLHETITPAMVGYGALILLGTALSALGPTLRMFKWS
ncbi:MAG: EamA family transporter [Brachymonas sp.]